MFRPSGPVFPEWFAFRFVGTRTGAEAVLCKSRLIHSRYYYRHFSLAHNPDSPVSFHQPFKSKIIRKKRPVNFIVPASCPEMQPAH
jgi:hypothetical protein